MPATLWMVQSNLGNADTYAQLERACMRNEMLIRAVEVVPFVNDVPDVAHDGPILAYGATRFIQNVVRSGKWRPGAFFDESLFTVGKSLRHWGSWMANSDGVLLALRSVHQLPFQSSDDVFVRPNDDLKSFAGGVMSFGELCDWAATIEAGRFEFDGSLLVAVASPKRIAAEWRVFAVAPGHVIAASRYRLDGRLAPQAGAPEAVRAFVEARLAQWMPTSALALDIAEIDGELRVMELSDIHSAGFYAADVESIVVETSRMARQLF